MAAWPRAGQTSLFLHVTLCTKYRLVRCALGSKSGRKIEDCPALSSLIRAYVQTVFTEHLFLCARHTVGALGVGPVTQKGILSPWRLLSSPETERWVGEAEVSYTSILGSEMNLLQF